jgi:hypothetical protein
MDKHVLHAYYNKIGEPLKLQTNSPFGPTDKSGII